MIGTCVRLTHLVVVKRLSSSTGRFVVFVLKQDPGVFPFLPDELVKVNRGMNMVKVSVGEHQSEPAEVYIATARDDENISTYIVFYLTGPEVRALYGFDGNPYPPAQRIDIETEATDFVEEMGAILEDIGWEGMSAESRKDWVDQQVLFPLDDELRETDPEPDKVGISDVLEEIQVLEPLPVEKEDVVADEIEADFTAEPVLLSETEKKSGHNEAAAKRSLDGGRGKIVFAEDQFDEMLKKAFISPSDDVPAGKPDPVESPKAPETREPATPGEAVGAAEAEVDVEGSPPAGEFSDGEKILLFLSKM